MEKMRIPNKAPVFSVCMVTYNHENYIKNSIESVISQKHKYSYELIISDDCSKDKTPDIIRKYAEKYPSIIKPIYNKKNLGAMKNYYQALSKCKGTYILFCDGDDFWEQGKVKTQVSFLENNIDFDFVYSKMQMFNPDNIRIGELGYNAESVYDVFKANPVPSSTLCFRSKIWKAYYKQIKPEQQPWLMEDFPFVLFLFNNCKHYFFNVYQAHYNVIENSLSHQKSIKKSFLFSQNVQAIKKFFAELYKMDIRIHTDKEVFKDCTNSLLKSNSSAMRKEAYELYNELHLKDFFLLLRCKNLFTNFLSRFINITKKVLRAVTPYAVIKKIEK